MRHIAVNNGVNRDRKRRESAFGRMTAFSVCREQFQTHRRSTYNNLVTHIAVNIGVNRDRHKQG